MGLFPPRIVMPTPPIATTSKNAILAAQADFWAARITASMRKSFNAVMETGNILLQAKAALPHGAWLATLKRAGLGRGTAKVWMRVARNPRYANGQPDALLPPCPTTLDLISRLPEDVYQRLLTDGTINAAVSRRQISGIVCRLAQKADERRILNLLPVPGKVRTAVIDAPWASAGGRGCPYAVMSQQQLLDLPLGQWLLDDAHVYLWATNAELLNAFSLFAHWGIRFNEMLVWNKTHPNGEPRMGMGQNFRHTCEFVLFGARGNLRTREALGTGFTASVVGGHSEKPDKFYEIVRAASYPPFGELFGRKPRDGFTNLYQEAAQDIMKAAA